MFSLFASPFLGSLDRFHCEVGGEYHLRNFPNQKRGFPPCVIVGAPTPALPESLEIPSSGPDSMKLTGRLPFKYGWWKKSCTSWYGKYPIIYVNIHYLQGFVNARWCMIFSINSIAPNCPKKGSRIIWSNHGFSGTKNGWKSVKGEKNRSHPNVFQLWTMWSKKW